MANGFGLTQSATEERRRRASAGRCGPVSEDAIITEGTTNNNTWYHGTMVTLTTIAVIMFGFFIWKFLQNNHNLPNIIRNTMDGYFHTSNFQDLISDLCEQARGTTNGIPLRFIDTPG